MPQYQVIDRNPDEMSQFVVDGKNVQFDYKSVQIGQIVHIALKEDIRPAARTKPGQKQLRYFAPYTRNVIVAPEMCTTCAHDHDADLQTICPDCIESWCWDWFVRSEKLWTSHGNYTSYSTYGCRCPECRLANKKHLYERSGRDVTKANKVRHWGLLPSVSVSGEKE
jgi:hypothetical protein